jgi:uncharacterized membrane protein YeaQ/YmgE (transglycosylase-associated protein family)
MESHPQAYGPSAVSVKTLMSFKGYSHAQRPNYQLEQRTFGERGARNMGIISWVVVGLIAGLLAKWFMPTTGPGGLIVTVLIGMAGASIGGFIVRLLGGTGATGFNVWSILVATLGAIILLFLYGLVDRRTA